MGFSKEAVTYVNDMFAQKRRNSSAELLEKKAELFSAVPRLRDIEKELSDCGLKTVRCVISRSPDIKGVIEKLREENMKLQKERVEILKSLQLPADYLEVKFDCPVCKDEGYVDGRMCSCYQKELKKYTYNKLNRSSHLKLSDFSKFNLSYYPDITPEGSAVSIRNKMEQIYSFCVSYAKNFCDKSGNILMSGATGLGKTFLSLCIASAAIEKGYGVIYSSAQNLLNNLEREKFGSSESGILDDVLECDLLIIDDLGTEFVTSFTVATVYNIINTRINTGKPVIINTNLSLSAMQEVYSERIVSRIIGEYTILKFVGNDIRQIKKLEGAKDGQKL